MATVNINTEIQRFLKDTQLYDGPIDGKIGTKSREAINNLLNTYGISAKGWSNSRKLVAAEQLLYSAHKIDDMKVADGLVGPATRHARDVFQAKLVTNWRDAAAVVEPPKTAEKNITVKHIWPLQKDCTSFYGKVGTNQDKCELPFKMVLAWDKGSTLSSYSCHKLVKAPMERIWQNTFDYYGYEKMKELRITYFGGCLNVRKMRGGSNWSMHSWGIAVDIDPDRNDLHTSWKNSQMSKPEYKKFVSFWYDEGFINLGLEADYDSMHFQAARLR